MRPASAIEPVVRPSARVKRVAALLDEDESQIRRMVARGDLEAHRTGKRGIRIYLDSVEHWQQTHAVTPTAQSQSAPTAPQRHVQPSPATRAAHRHAMAELRALGLVE